MVWDKQESKKEDYFLPKEYNIFLLQFHKMFFLFFSINYLPFLAASVWMRHPDIVAWYVNWHLGKVRAVTLLAPGRRWSLTYGSASPLESMAFSPCRHKQTHTHTLWCQRWRHHTLKHFTQRTGSKTDRLWQAYSSYIWKAPLDVSYHATILCPPGLLYVDLKGMVQRDLHN